MKVHKLVPLCGALLLVVSACGCNKLKARDQLNKGVQAFRNAQFPQAVKHFQSAVELDPNLLNAKLYLATSYAQQYIPGGDSDDNKKIGQQAIDAFEDVLKADPTNASAMGNIASIYYNEKKFDNAKEYQERWLKLEPNNPVPYYWIGVLDWAVCFPRAQTVRVDHDLAAPDKDGNLKPIPLKFRDELAEKNGALVDEGLKALQKAIELKPNDADTMAYLNLMYRQKAEIDTDDDTRQADLKSAEDWVEKSVAERKVEANQPAPATPAAGQ